MSTPPVPPENPFTSAPQQGPAPTRSPGVGRGLAMGLGGWAALLVTSSLISAGTYAAVRPAETAPVVATRTTPALPTTTEPAPATEPAPEATASEPAVEPTTAPGSALADRVPGMAGPLLPQTPPKSLPGTGLKATVPGWKVVVNPGWGVAYDVPADWVVEDPQNISGVEYKDPKAPFGYSPVAHTGAVVAGPTNCSVGKDDEGRPLFVAAGHLGSKGAAGAKSTADEASDQAPWWVFAGFTDPDTEAVRLQDPVPLRTASGLTGHYARAYSVSHQQRGACSTNGKAYSFAFVHPQGGPEVVSFYGVTGVKGEIPDATVLKILSTVRAHGKPTKLTDRE